MITSARSADACGLVGSRCGDRIPMFRDLWPTHGLDAGKWCAWNEMARFLEDTLAIIGLEGRSPRNWS